ncbi:MAG TPA: NAD(P)-dependent oxidoreductase [Kineosporiaceae bacterium]|nr:NAD(P)-dependent oxidoreductase [Kineosporiaceae bacterium]
MVITDMVESETTVVLLSRRGGDSLALEHRQQLAAMADVKAYALEKPPTRRQARELLAPADVLAVTNACLPVLDDDLLGRLPRLRTVVLFATGHDAVDLEALRRHGVNLIAVPDYATVSVAEHALGMLLSMTNRLHLANDRSLGRCPPGVSLRGVQMSGRTACVIGLGRIGLHLCSLLLALGTRVVGVDPDPLARQCAAAAGVECVGLVPGLTVADAVILTASRAFGDPPVLDRERLRLLPAHAFLINVGRKELVDTPAVIEALTRQALRGYAVDDVVINPADRRGNGELVRTGRLLQSGHRAWWTDEALHRGTYLWGERIIAAIAVDPGAVPARRGGEAE